MKDLFFFLFVLGVVALGVAAPFVMTLGYMWASLLKPQLLAFGFFKSLPIAMMFALLAAFTYVLIDRRSPPKFTAVHMLLFVFAGWITLTTFNAQFPSSAWWKWDWAFKEIAFACFIPFVIRTRVQIESVLYVMTVGTVPLVVSAGLKAAVGGGGYGAISVGAQSNAGLTESSTLAMYATMMIVMVLYLRKHTLIMPRNWIATLGVAGYIATCLLAIIGGYSRTGLIAIAVLAAAFWWYSRYKISLAILFVALAGIGTLFVSDEWVTRMQTILEPTADSSASTRLNVWAWTWEYVKSHPFGGGFVAYIANVGSIPGQDGPRAFHSIYFEVLGEHGYVGLGIYLAILLTTAKMSWGLYRRNLRNPEIDVAVGFRACPVDLHSRVRHRRGVYRRRLPAHAVLSGSPDHSRAFVRTENARKHAAGRGEARPAVRPVRSTPSRARARPRPGALTPDCRRPDVGEDRFSACRWLVCQSWRWQPRRAGPKLAGSVSAIRQVLPHHA